jgi:hypothetical protein
VGTAAGLGEGTGVFQCCELGSATGPFSWVASAVRRRGNMGVLVNHAWAWVYPFAGVVLAPCMAQALPFDRFVWHTTADSELARTRGIRLSN